MKALTTSTLIGNGFSLVVFYFCTNPDRHGREIHQKQIIYH